VCCGSAGTYSILQAELSGQLLANKVKALESGKPAAICTSNIGCLLHIESGASKPVSHWIELLDRRLAPGGRPPGVDSGQGGIPGTCQAGLSSHR
jgi:glycolate oxidase iron-sulfur subunit